MRIVCLIENNPGRPGCRFEHGLGLYIETERHRLLADTGASNALLENAALLGIDLSRVDTVFLSHGHYDHAGGLPSLIGAGLSPVLLMQKSAALPYYGMDPEGPRYIGIDRSILSLPGLRALEGSFDYDGELSVLAGFPGRRGFSASNRRLTRKEGDLFVQDDFTHEQALIVRENGKTLLFSGCAHNGILNILDRYRGEYGADPDLVISGFHFMKAGPYTPEEEETILKTAEELRGMDTLFYTGHCTSLPAFALMKNVMGEKLQALHSGLELPVF